MTVGGVVVLAFFSVIMRAETVHGKVESLCSPFTGVCYEYRINHHEPCDIFLTDPEDDTNIETNGEYYIAAQVARAPPGGRFEIWIDDNFITKGNPAETQYTLTLKSKTHMGEHELHFVVIDAQNNTLMRRTHTFRISGAEQHNLLDFEEAEEMKNRFGYSSYTLREMAVWAAAVRYHVDRQCVFNQKFLGYYTTRYPQDAWMYQELMYESKIDIFLELGSHAGGGALLWSSLFEVLDPDHMPGGGKARVITVDVMDKPNPTPGMPPVTEHWLWKKRVISFFGKTSIDPTVVQQVRDLCKGKRVFLLVDSLHTREHALRELELYADLVAVGSYFIAEDTSIRMPRFFRDFPPGPLEAIEEFMESEFYQQHFVWDKRAENKLYLSNNPVGYHKRVR